MPIERLELQKNQIDDNCMASLGELINDGNSKLKHVNLGFNNISDHGILLLSQLVEGNTILSSLILQGNPNISKNATPALIQLIESTHVVEIITNVNIDESKNTLAIYCEINHLKRGGSVIQLNHL